MKANEAPEKIYLNPLLMEDGESIVKRCTFERQRDSQLEYTRTDAFIEKACAWFKTLDDKEPPYETTEEFIEGFIKAMEQ